VDLKSRVRRQLETVRGMTEMLLSAFKTPEQWTLRVHDQANPALWVAGHLGTVDNFMISLLDPEKAAANQEYQAKFAMGSQPTSNPDDYPEVGQVLDFMRERRTVVLEILAGMTEEGMSQPPPKGTPAIMPDLGSIFETAVWHEALHAGQVTIARRALGHPPLADAPPKTEADG
jgi:uncharacterized damage-inducible protein DinB